VFSDDSLKNKRNTDAVDVGKGVLVAARVLESKPAALRPFDEVRADIEKMLVQEEAAVLAEKDGEKKLAQLVKGDAVPLEWGLPVRSSGWSRVSRPRSCGRSSGLRLTSCQATRA
jgi:peptidyl-prolyl cis-trans isomerase D